MTLAPAETFDAIVYPTPRRGVNGDAGDNAGVDRTMARSERFELPTPKFVAWCSIQLSYERNRYMLPNKHPFRQAPIANSGRQLDAVAPIRSWRRERDSNPRYELTP